jgi:hypothetical protein
MIKFSHIAPTQYIEAVSSKMDCFLSLAHLVEKDQAYVDAHKMAYAEAAFDDRDIVRIMDNSAFEYYKEHGKGYVFDPDKLLELADKIQADYIVLPDYPAEAGSTTIEASRKYAPVFRENGFGTFFCPQSNIGDLDDYLKCVDWAAGSNLIDYIGISILGVPNAFAVEKNNKLQRYNSRAWLMKLLYEGGTLDKIRNNGKKVHFLGMVDGPNEIKLVSEYEWCIDSWDSSAAVWAGLNGVKFDSSPTGLVNGKFETPVNFDHPYSNDRYLDLARYNIDYINRLIDEVS